MNNVTFRRHPDMMNGGGSSEMLPGTMGKREEDYRPSQPHSSIVVSQIIVNTSFNITLIDNELSKLF